jgi:hypothetical protein
MGAYRLYFLNETGSIIAAEVYDARTDDEARAIGAVLVDACSDMARGYEVWQVNRRIARHADCDPSLVERARQLLRQREEHLLQLEERLRDSRWRIAKSKRLLDRINGLRGLETSK